ncbi:MAG: response regulator [Desulfobacterales bacterium]|nr:response regulator [Desulfobacterales bacterium]MBF0396662.1 response regulator [Desulfobacterales bacterium]
MKSLIVDDDFHTRIILKQLLKVYGECDTVADGEEAIQAFKLALEDSRPYDLICLDIMMPYVDGHNTLLKIREIEKNMGLTKPSQEVKVIMITGLSDPKNAVKALHKGGATSYLVKPVDNKQLVKELKSLQLIR